jgi:hypothetical protein
MAGKAVRVGHRSVDESPLPFRRVQGWRALRMRLGKSAIRRVLQKARLALGHYGADAAFVRHVPGGFASRQPPGSMPSRRECRHRHWRGLCRRAHSSPLPARGERVGGATATSRLRCSSSSPDDAHHRPIIVGVLAHHCRHHCRHRAATLSGFRKARRGAWDRSLHHASRGPPPPLRG